MTKHALITGITGQDGSYLAELLLGKGYEVHGVIRRSSSFNTGRLEGIYADPRLHLHYGDMLDPSSLRAACNAAQPDEIYNLAAQSHVAVSFKEPVYTTQTIADGTLNMLEVAREYNESRGCGVRFYQASSSEMFGNMPAPQNEMTALSPCSPYACAKALAHHAATMYRDAYRMFVCSGILFNHESPRRGETFVTRKITRAATRIKLGLQTKLHLGNIEAMRDWGHAQDYVEAMWRMLQQGNPDDYVIATGETRTVKDFAEYVFAQLGLNLADHLVIDDRYRRPRDVKVLHGDASKARSCLCWSPRTTYKVLVREMIDADMSLAEREAHAAGQSEAA